jgi:hypothetical protein
MSAVAGFILLVMMTSVVKIGVRRLFRGRPKGRRDTTYR